jgi:hypothetical protein
MSRKSLVKLFLSAAGLILFLFLANSTGWRLILNTIQRHAFFLLILVCVFFLYHLLRTYTLKLCIPAPCNFWHVFQFRLAGESFAYFALGTVAGEFVKIALAKDRLAASDVATGVFAEKLIYSLSGAAFIVCGLLVASYKLGANRWILLVIAILSISFFIVLYLMSSGVRPLSYLFRKYRDKAFFRTLQQSEEGVFRFRSLYPRKFLAVFVLNFASYFYAVVEAGFIFNVLGYSLNFLQLWYLQAVLKTANSANLILPANIGIFEATHMIVTKQLLLGTEAGMLVALMVRVRAILWSLIGYFVFLYLLHNVNREVQ